MKSILGVLSFSVFLLLIGETNSQTLYVDSAIATPGNGSSWSSAFASLGDALDSAHKNPNIDSILVAKGTYIPTKSPHGVTSGNINDLTFHIREGLEVYGGYSNGGGTRDIVANSTILSGANSTDSFIHVVIMGSSSNTDTSKLDGVIVEKGYFRPNARSFPLNLGTNTIYHISGGGVYIFGGSNIINRCTIRNNNASEFGAGISAYSSNTIIKSCLIHNNYDNNIGTGIYMNRGNYFISKNIIQNNQGLSVYSNQSSVDFIGNLVRTNNGGGMQFEDSSSRIVNNIFSNNIGSFGGGIYTRHGGTHYIVNNTFSRNQGIGGGFMADLGSINYLYNNIFWENKNSFGYTDSFGSDIFNKSTTIISQNNLFQVDSILISLQPIAAGSVNNLYKINPEFKGGLGADSLSLLPTSPIINKGDSILYAWFEKLDFLSADRIQKNNIDLGAIESDTCISIVSIDQTICNGDSFALGTNYIKTSGTYKDTITNSLTCDSIITLNLTVLPCLRDTTAITMACAPVICGHVVSFNSSVTMSTISSNGVPVLNSDGRITYTPNPNFTGIDTIIKVVCILQHHTATIVCDTAYIFLTVVPNPTTDVDTSICKGSVYVFNGQQLNLSGVYYDTFVSSKGCDSIIRLHLNMLPVATSVINASICQGKSYLFNGVQRFVSGIYKDTFVTTKGCDSIVSLNLAVLTPPIITFVDSSDFASSYSWRGNSYSSAGTYFDTSSASNICDTIYKLVLTNKSAIPPAAPPLEVLYSNGALYASIDSASSYQWYLCGPPMKKITGANKRFFHVSDISLYTVVVTKNGKTDTAACASNSSIRYSSSDFDFRYFPNPVSNTLTIEIERKFSELKIEIFDIAGQRLWYRDFGNFQSMDIDMKFLPLGLYFMHIQSTDRFQRIFKITKD